MFARRGLRGLVGFASSVCVLEAILAVGSPKILESCIIRAQLQPDLRE
jgi:hypothetical protein